MGPLSARNARAPGLRALRGGAVRAPDCACAREPNAWRTPPVSLTGSFSRRRETGTGAAPRGCHSLPPAPWYHGFHDVNAPTGINANTHEPGPSIGPPIERTPPPLAATAPPSSRPAHAARPSSPLPLAEGAGGGALNATDPARLHGRWPPPGLPRKRGRSNKGRRPPRHLPRRECRGAVRPTIPLPLAGYRMHTSGTRSVLVWGLRFGGGSDSLRLTGFGDWQEGLRDGRGRGVFRGPAGGPVVWVFARSPCAAGSSGSFGAASGGSRAGEVRIGRFLRNDKVTVEKIVDRAAAGTASRVAGLDVLAIQDRTGFRDDGLGNSLVGHATIAVEGEQGALPGLVDARVIERHGGGGRGAGDGGRRP